MIVQCDECSAKFRLDDSKLKDGGAKVRCSKCKHIFMVQKEASAEEADYDSFLNGLVSSDESAEQPERSAAPAAAPAAAAVEPSIPEIATDALRGPAIATDDFDFGDFAFESGPAPTEPPAEMSAASAVKGEFDFAEFEAPSDPSSTAALAPAAADEFDFQDFAMQDAAPPAPTPEPDLTGGLDLGDMDFSSGSASAQPGGPAIIGEFDFDDSATSAASSDTAPAVPGPQIDFGELTFNEEAGVGAAPVESEVPGDFAFGELDFGGETSRCCSGRFRRCNDAG